MIKQIIIWTLIFNFIGYFMYIQYTNRYLDSQANMLEVDYNLSTSYKSYFIITLFLAFTTIFIPLLYYIYFYILNQSNINLAFFIFLCWSFWDAYPVFMTDNGYKMDNILIQLFDCIYAGPIWVIISLYFYNNFYKVFDNNIVILILFILNILIMLLFFYNCFIYNREHTENNWLVKIGDKLNWDKYLKYIMLFKSKKDKTYNIMQ
jgi:hypothetical protein